jgi:hypothetical protein
MQDVMGTAMINEIHVSRYVYRAIKQLLFTIFDFHLNHSRFCLLKFIFYALKTLSYRNETKIVISGNRFTGKMYDHKSNINETAANFTCNHKTAELIAHPPCTKWQLEASLGFHTGVNGTPTSVHC